MLTGRRPVSRRLADDELGERSSPSLLVRPSSPAALRVSIVALLIAGRRSELILGHDLAGWPRAMCREIVGSARACHRCRGSAARPGRGLTDAWPAVFRRRGGSRHGDALAACADRAGALQHVGPRLSSGAASPTSKRTALRSCSLCSPRSARWQAGPAVGAPWKPSTDRSVNARARASPESVAPCDCYSTQRPEADPQRQVGDDPSVIATYNNRARHGAALLRIPAHIEPDDRLHSMPINTRGPASFPSPLRLESMIRAPSRGHSPVSRADCRWVAAYSPRAPNI